MQTFIGIIGIVEVDSWAPSIRKLGDGDGEFDTLFFLNGLDKATEGGGNEDEKGWFDGGSADYWGVEWFFWLDDELVNELPRSSWTQESPELEGIFFSRQREGDEYNNFWWQL